MSSVNRTLLAIAVGVVLVSGGALLGEALDLSSWAITGLAAACGLLATLVDREGFYGAGRRHHARRS